MGFSRLARYISTGKTLDLSESSPNREICVKSADRPDSVQPLVLRLGAVTAIPLGRLSPERLDATYPHTPRDESTCAYLVLLRVEIARFTRTDPKASPTRLCCSDPHLAVERCYLLRYPVQSGPSSSAPFRGLHQRRSGRLHGRDHRPFTNNSPQIHSPAACKAFTKRSGF
jgi:hypothetical protein